MPDSDFFALARKVGYANKWGFDHIIGHELNARLIVALVEFKKSADRSSRTLKVLTVVLVVLTIVLVVYAVRAG